VGLLRLGHFLFPRTVCGPASRWTDPFPAAPRQQVPQLLDQVCLHSSLLLCNHCLRKSYRKIMLKVFLLNSKATVEIISALPQIFWTVMLEHLCQWFSNLSEPLPNQGSDYVLLLSIFCVVIRTQLVHLCLYIGSLKFRFCVTPRRIAYHPRRVIYPQFGNHWLMRSINSKQVHFINKTNFCGECRWFSFWFKPLRDLHVTRGFCPILHNS